MITGYELGRISRQRHHHHGAPYKVGIDVFLPKPRRIGPELLLEQVDRSTTIRFAIL